MSTLKEIIREEISSFLNEEDVDWGLYEAMDSIFHETVQGFLDAREKGGGKQPWNFLPFPRLKKIWEDYMKFGFVRDVKGLDQIERIMTRNILKLNANTELSGHVSYSVDDKLEEYGMTWEDFWEGDFTFDDYMRDEITNISDYGLDPLLKLLGELRKQTKPEDKLVTIDKMLNVIHQTSDLANIFLRGGSTDLDKLSGYYTPEDPDYEYSDEVSSISGKYKLGDYR
jgi:hypothetical protein